MSPKLMRPTQVGVRKPNPSVSSPPTVSSPRKAAASIKTNAGLNSRRSSEEDEDDAEEFNEEKLRTIRDKAALK